MIRTVIFDLGGVIVPLDARAEPDDQAALLTHSGSRVVLTDGPVSYWRLDEEAGLVAVDETATNPGVYSGTPSYGQNGASVLVPPPPKGVESHVAGTPPV